MALSVGEVVEGPGTAVDPSTTFDFMYKVLIVGNSGVGKTAFLLRYCNNIFSPSFVATVGIDFKVKSLFRQDKHIKLQIWDTAGHERYRINSITAYYRGAMGFILMFDLTNEESFLAVKGCYSAIKDEAWEESQMVLVGNKSDLTESRAISKEQGLDLAQSLGVDYYESSAKDDLNVKQTFERLSDSITEKICRHKLVEKSNPVPSPLNKSPDHKPAMLQPESLALAIERHLNLRDGSSTFRLADDDEYSVFDHKLKVVIVGNSGTGKTVFLERYCKDSVTSAFNPTQGIDMAKKILLRQDKKLVVELWDTSGQERYCAMTLAYFRGGLGFVLMFDLTNEESFLAVKGWFTMIQENVASGYHINVLLVGNKSDLTESRVISKEQGLDLAQSLGVDYYEASAKDDLNVKQTFETLVNMIAGNGYKLVPIAQPSSAPS